SGKRPSAMESIRNLRPKLVAVDAVFAQSLTGAAFIERVEKLAVADCEVRLVARIEGSWVTTPHRPSKGVVLPSDLAAAPAREPARPAAPVAALVAVPAAARRAARARR